jgi:hypothetical protein
MGAPYSIDEVEWTPEGIELIMVQIELGPSAAALRGRTFSTGPSFLLVRSVAPRFH